MRVRQSIHRGNRESDARQDKRTRQRYTGLLVRKPPQFRNTLTKRGIFLFGKKLSLLIVTLTGTHVGSKRLSIYDFILITSIEIVELKFQKLGNLRSESILPSRPTTKRTCEGTTSNSRNNNEDRNAPIAANHHATNSDT